MAELWLSKQNLILLTKYAPPHNIYVHSGHTWYFFSTIKLVIADTGFSIVASQPITTLFRLPITVISTGGNIIARVGENVTLSCAAENFIFRQWQSTEETGALLITNSSDGRRVISDNSDRLIFQGIQLEHRGEYVCVLINEVGSQQVTYSVTVTSKCMQLLQSYP